MNEYKKRGTKSNLVKKTMTTLPKIWLQNEKYELQNTKDGHENSKELGVTTTGNITSGSSTNCLWKLCVQVPWWLMMNEIRGMISFAMIYLKSFTGYILVIYKSDSWLWLIIPNDFQEVFRGTHYKVYISFFVFSWSCPVLQFCDGKNFNDNDWQLVVVLTKV